MNISLVFYLISVLHNVNVVLNFFLAALIIFASVFMFLLFLTYTGGKFEEQTFLSMKDFLNRYIKAYFVVLVSVVFIICLIPSSLTMYSLVGVNYLSDSKIPEKVVKLVNLKIDEYIENQASPKKDK